MSSACTDHKGQEFPSLRAMAAAWGVNEGTFKWRLRRGWSVHDALIATVRGRGGKQGRPITDYDGRDFRSIAAMARWYRLPYDVVYWRLRHGWHPELVVEEPVRVQKRKEGR